MNYRFAKVLAEEDVGASGTKPIQIRTKDPISRLMIRWKVTKSKHGMDAPAPADISRIELKNGSDVLHSLTGYENQALCLYDRRVDTMQHGQYLSACSQESEFGIDFGRFLWDPELAFLPGHFDNPTLYITYDRDVSDTGVSANGLEVWAALFDQKAVSPVGFLMAKEHYDYTCGANNSYEHIDLPNDHPIRQLLVRAYRDGYEPWYQIKEARLDENNLARIPFDYDSLENYVRMMKGVWKPIQEQVVGVCTSAGDNAFYVCPTDYYAMMIGNLVGTSGSHYVDTWQKGGKYTPYSSTGSPFFWAMIQGWLPWHCYQFPLGRQDLIDDWYDVAQVVNPRLRLRASTSAANGTGQVVLQQLRRY